MAQVENIPPAGVTSQVTRDQVTAGAGGAPVRMVEAYAQPQPQQGQWSGRSFDQLKSTEFKVVQREQVANPAPLGLLGFGFTTALLQGYNTGIVEKSTNNIVIGYAFMYGGLAQLLAGLWEFKRQNTFGASAFSSYGAFWMGWGLFNVFAKTIPGYTLPYYGDKMFLSLWGIITFIFMIGTLTLNFALWLLFIGLATLFWVLAGGVGSLDARAGAGWLGLFVAGTAWYIAAADIINENYKRTVLPLGKWNVGVRMFRGFKRIFGKIPLIGWAYVKACNREDRLAGYVVEHKKVDDRPSIIGPSKPGDLETGATGAAAHARGDLDDSAVYPRAYQLHSADSILPGGFEGDAVRRQARQADVGSGIGPY